MSFFGITVQSPRHFSAVSDQTDAVDGVMIGGRMALWGRQFTFFDCDALRRRVDESAGCRRQHNAETRERMEAMTEFVSHHCVGLVRDEYHVQRRLDPVEPRKV